MTTMPVEQTLNQTISLASVDELVAQAQRLGLTWSLRPATVSGIEDGGSPYNPRVVLDGDTANTQIQVTSLIGGVALGMRVMIMFVPPIGHYVIGIISTDDLRRYEIGTLANHGTSITTVETVMETFPQFTVLSGAAYRVEIGGGLLAATTTFTTFRIRKTNAAGQSLNASDLYPGVGIGTAFLYHTGHFRNTTSQAVTANLVLTAVTSAVSSTWLGDAERPRYVAIQYAGPAVEYPSAVSIV